MARTSGCRSVIFVQITAMATTILFSMNWRCNGCWLLPIHPLPANPATDRQHSALETDVDDDNDDDVNCVVSRMSAFDGRLVDCRIRADLQSSSSSSTRRDLHFLPHSPLRVTATPQLQYLLFTGLTA